MEELYLSYTIKDMPESERPREKLIKYGPESLSNRELLAIIIRTGNKSDTALDLSQKVLNLNKSGLANLVDISLEELMSVKGIGESKASQILAAIELGKRINYERNYSKLRVVTAETVSDLFMDEMKFLKQEHFKVLLLDTKNQVISIEEISKGTLNISIVHPRDVFKAAVRRNANSLILVHNHPSGDPTPSIEDKKLTKRLVEAGRIIGIPVLDHIVIGFDRYISFMREGLI